MHKERNYLEIGGGEGAEAAVRGGGCGRGGSPGVEPEGGARRGGHRRPPAAVLSAVAGGSRWVTGDGCWPLGPGGTRPPGLARSGGGGPAGRFACFRPAGGLAAS